MTRCDAEKGRVQTICSQFNQLLEGAKEEYRNIGNEDKDRLGLVLTWLDQEFHSFFKEIGITPDILIPALNELDRKIIHIENNIEKIVGLKESIDDAIRQALSGPINVEISKIKEKTDKIDNLSKNVNNIKTETDKIKDLAKKNDLNDLISKIDDIKTETDTIPTLFKYDEIGEIQGSINLAMRPVHSKIEALVKKSDLGVDNESVDLKELVKKSDLNGLAKTSYLSNLVKKSDFDQKVNSIKIDTYKIRHLAKDNDLKNLAGKIDNIEVAINKIDSLDRKVDSVKSEADKISDIKIETDKINDLAKTIDLPDISNLAKTSDLNNLVKKSDLDRLNQQVTDFTKQDQAFDQIITQKIKAISQGVNIIPQEVKVEFVKGNKVGGRYETEIKLEGNKIGTFSPTGYYFFDNRIYIHDHLNSKISIDLPLQYHFLKVVKTEEDGYKLVFCNEGGQEYYKIPSNYRLISSENLNGTKNINFEKYYAKNGSEPSFVVKMNSTSYPNSSQHGVDVYEIGDGEKKIGSLIDEFGYYDSQNKFHYFNNHINAQNHSYNSPSFTIHRGDIECSLHKMQEGTDDIDLTSDAAACSLVEYVANYVYI
ncbi:MAG: hypothetical protein sL5_10900 [Candidatus Mesenet longicola]|uniref:Uncharacterized protein n=1 Tax=Candidatus Mesenet longicola TaxID=1892558 RepID=A0A8J3HVL4_9RICK|nr:MAG: hypothetical protein sGL2_11320 [Candidatus Mesenet longicola]GHM60097.1 MAG: hypothetical protein sL5_10900 [Candidatus Mesenet longicola]